jgi:hypothetical protein
MHTTIERHDNTAPAGRRAWKHTPTPVRAPHQPRRPDQSGLSREELRKIVTDLLG